ncbi:SREC-like protein [Mya arenaria]|uniref:SREC-like protein n=1 Tax=Mya arenaria TaxID=6604 RepID=A0ABY7DP33_MYAAR|nr:SREC-like protein [Mya arenaria]
MAPGEPKKNGNKADDVALGVNSRHLDNQPDYHYSIEANDGFYDKFKLYVENYPSNRMLNTPDDRNYIPPDADRQLCYQHDGLDTPRRNVALKKTASSSEDNQQTSDPGAAVDGTTTTPCVFVTATNPWWEVDLGTKMKVNRIVISEYSTECDDGRFGTGCFGTCGHCLDGLPCNKRTGYCDQGYAPGWTAEPTCKQECADGSYGLACNQTCSKTCNGTCEKKLGICPDCIPGVGGDFCDEECLPGMYGARCKHKCGACGNRTTCHTASGICATDVCEPGYKITDKCHEVCDNGHFGHNCSHKCGNCEGVCNKANGHCEHGCIDGFEGEACLTQAQASGPGLVAAVGGSVGVVVVMAVLLGQYRYLHTLVKEMLVLANEPVSTENFAETYTIQGEVDVMKLQALYEDYINDKRFVISQTPLKTTVIDYLRLIHEHNIRLVIAFDDHGDEKAQFMFCYESVVSYMNDETTYANL